MENPRARRNQSYSAEGPLETILPVQFHNSRYRGHQMESLRRLMFAILEHGVKCFQANFEARNKERRREFLEAQWWLFKSNGVGPFSFENVCDVLGVHPDHVRRSLLAWRTRRLAALDAAASEAASETPALPVRGRRQRLRLVPS
jgi:hypothetical protein